MLEEPAELPSLARYPELEDALEEYVPVVFESVVRRRCFMIGTPVDAFMMLIVDCNCNVDSVVVRLEIDTAVDDII